MLETEVVGASTKNHRLSLTAGRSPGRKNSKPKIPGWHGEEESAGLLGESVATRRRNRRRGIGPKWARHGRHILHPDGAEEEYLAELLRQQEAAAEPPRRGRPRRAG